MYEDSTVRFSKRINFDVGCQMDFSDYPVDMQICEVKFESFGYQVHEVFFEWDRGGDLVANKDITLPQGGRSWRASGDHQISLTALARSACLQIFATKTPYFTIANFCNINVIFLQFCQQNL